MFFFSSLSTDLHSSLTLKTSRNIFYGKLIKFKSMNRQTTSYYIFKWIGVNEDLSPQLQNGHIYNPILPKITTSNFFSANLFNAFHRKWEKGAGANRGVLHKKEGRFWNLSSLYALSVLEHSVLECSLFLGLFISHLIHSLSQLHSIPFQMPVIKDWTGSLWYT